MLSRHKAIGFLLISPLIGCGGTVDVGDRIVPADGADAAAGSGNATNDAGSPVLEGGTDPNGSSPTADPAIDIATGAEVSCAVRASGEVWCWGAGFSPVPTHFPVFDGAKAIALSRGNDSRVFGCVILRTGSVRCSEASNGGAISLTTGAIRELPGITDAVRVTIGTDVDHRQGHCVLRASGRVSCFNAGAAPLDLGLAGATDVYSGFRRSCAVTPEGVTCWGATPYGVPCKDPNDCSNGSGVFGSLDVELRGNFTRVMGNDAWRCAAQATGNLLCWGVVPPDGNIVFRSAADPWIEVADKAPSMDTGGSVDGQAGVHGTHACTVAAHATNPGSVYCWGYNLTGQAGYPPLNGIRVYPPEPVMIRDTQEILAGAVKVSTGYDHTCTLQKDGAMYCWGDNFNGELGDGTSRDQRYLATKVLLPPSGAGQR
jgi:hypothetical protein